MSTALSGIVSTIQCKLDILIENKNYNLAETTVNEKEYMKRIRDTFKEFIHPEQGGTSKQRMLQRNDVRDSLNEIHATLFDIESLKTLTSSHFSIFNALIGTIEDSLAEFRKVCAIRSNILELCYKMIFVIIAAIADKLLVYGDGLEKQIWQQVRKMNSTVESQIEKISKQLTETRRKEEDWKSKLDLARSESFYLSKMIRLIEHNNKHLLAQMKNLELEKAILANDLINNRMELAQVKNSGATAGYQPKLGNLSPQKVGSTNNIANSPTTNIQGVAPFENSIQDVAVVSEGVHSRWQKLSDSLNSQLQTKNYYIAEFEKDMNNLIRNGLERVKKQNVDYEGKIREVGMWTVDLEAGGRVDKHTQTAFKIAEAGFKVMTADVGCQASYVEMVKLQTANDHKIDSKVMSRYSIIYQIKECLHLRELLDEYIFNPLNNKHPKRLEAKKMVTDQFNYILIHKDLAAKITDALEGVEAQKLKYNSIGETLTILKEENKKLQANNQEYENQNHEITKKVAELRSKLAGSGEKLVNESDPEQYIDSKVIDRVDKIELTMIVADYVIEIKDKLIECLATQDLGPSAIDKINGVVPRQSIFRRDSVRRESMQVASINFKQNETIAQRFLALVKPYMEYNFDEKQEVIGVDGQEKVQLTDIKATPCTTFVTKLINLFKSSINKKVTPFISNTTIIKDNSNKITPKKTLERNEALPPTGNPTFIIGIKTISQIIHMKSLAKRIRLVVLNTNPDFKTASRILQDVLSKKDKMASMPIPNIIKLIADIYMSILYELKVDSEDETKVSYTNQSRLSIRCSSTRIVTFSHSTQSKN